MSEWFGSLGGSGYASAMVWTLAALLLLLIVLGLVRIVRGLTAGTFVAGGRNRKTRLAVMDAAAVDSQRRLVLVRRDDVEHLILIGGNADVVIEQNIRLAPPVTRNYVEDAPKAAEEAPTRSPRSQSAPAASAPSPLAESPDAASNPRNAPTEVRPPVAPSPIAPAPVVPAPVRHASPVTTPKAFAAPEQHASAAAPWVASEPPSRGPTASAPLAVAATRPVHKVEQDPMPEFDESLLEELQVTLEQGDRDAAPKAPLVAAPAAATPRAAYQQRVEGEVPPSGPRTPAETPPSIEDEMSRLLGELSGNRR